MSDGPTPCPFCGRELHDPCTVDICGTCHASVVGSGNIRVAATGEFRVEQIMAAAQALDGSIAMTPDGDVACSWCGKPDTEVRKLLSRGPLHICNECVALCAAVMSAELGDDWR